MVRGKRKKKERISEKKERIVKRNDKRNKFEKDVNKKRK